MGEEQTAKINVVDSQNSQASVDSGTDDATGPRAAAEIIDGRYEILERLGEGATGSVYKVRHILLGTTLALKLLKSGEVDSDRLLRFKQESRMLGLLNHPNIISARDFGVTAGGHVYMVMDYVDGEAMGGWINSLEPSELIRLFVQVCSALSHAHERGIVHRDIKPSNIIISRDEAGTRYAVLVDFGVAKFLSPDEAAGQNLTRTGELFGTPLYMSPEQCIGTPIDARSDIYSLGCVMYEAFAGRPPLRGETIYETISKQINEAPPPFPDAFYRRPGGRMIEAMILKAMAKAPADRYRYAIQLAGDLKALENGPAGVFGHAGVLWQVFTRRINAFQRKAVIEMFWLRLLSMAAIALFLLLLLLPPQIEKLRAEYGRNEAIAECLDKISSNFKERKLNSDPAVFFPAIKRLKELCRNDHAHKEQLREYVKSLLTAQKKTQELTNRFLSSFNEQSFDFAKLSSIKLEMSDLVTLWAVENEQASKLRVAAANTMQQCQETMLILNMVLSLAAVAAPALALALLVLWGRKFLRRRDSAIPGISRDSNP